MDLDKWIYDPPSESEDEFKSKDLTFMMTSGMGGDGHSPNLNSPALRSKKGKKRKGKKGAEEDDEDEEFEKVRMTTI